MQAVQSLAFLFLQLAFLLLLQHRHLLSQTLQRSVHLLSVNPSTMKHTWSWHWSALCLCQCQYNETHLIMTLVCSLPTPVQWNTFNHDTGLLTPAQWNTLNHDTGLFSVNAIQWNTIMTLVCSLSTPVQWNTIMTLVCSLLTPVQWNTLNHDTGLFSVNASTMKHNHDTGLLSVNASTMKHT